MSDQLPRSRNRALPKRKQLVVRVLIGGVAAIGLAAAFNVNWPTASIAGAVPNDPEQVAMGRAVYQQSCASCHGANLEGQPDWHVRKPDGKLPAPPLDETGHTWHHPDEHLFRIIKNGVKPPLAPIGYESDMPAFDDVLSDEKIWAVLAFIKSSWPTRIRSRQQRFNEAYQQ